MALRAATHQSNDLFGLRVFEPRPVALPGSVTGWLSLESPEGAAVAAFSKRLVEKNESRKDEVLDAERRKTHR
jgi:hypothetical protein